VRRLVIDCATEACSVALLDGTDIVAGTFEMLGRGHAERLVPMIAALPGSGRADAIAVNIGPGSFTGIRVGLAAAKALGLAWNVPVDGYESLALVAAMAQAEASGPVGVAMTGGHGEWFVQSFDASGTALGGVASLAPGDAARCLQTPAVVGTQALGLVARRGTGTALELWPDARCFALLDAAALVRDPAPAYGRAPDAKLPARA